MITEKLTHARCIKLLKENETPRNIWLHNRKVNSVAMFLAKQFTNKGIELDLESIDKASLMHDIKKYHELSGILKDMHEIEAEKLFNKLNQTKIANLVGKHKTSALLNKNLLTWEEKIVFYADKRVLHDKIVSIDERIEDGTKRYKDNHHYTGDEKLISLKMHDLESQIFKKLGMKPTDINEENVKPFLVEDEY
jgi:uncharacterized protein